MILPRDRTHTFRFTVRNRILYNVIYVHEFETRNDIAAYRTKSRRRRVSTLIIRCGGKTHRFPNNDLIVNLIHSQNNLNVYTVFDRDLHGATYPVLIEMIKLCMFF